MTAARPSVSPSRSSRSRARRASDDLGAGDAWRSRGRACARCRGGRSVGVRARAPRGRDRGCSGARVRPAQRRRLCRQGRVRPGSAGLRRRAAGRHDASRRVDRAPARADRAGGVLAAARRARHRRDRHARARRRARVFSAEPRYLVPVGGMVIGNAMTASAVALNRLGDDVRQETPRIEATLALGAPAREALRPVMRRSLRSGLIPLIDSTKTTGLVFFPGTMVGMLLAGAAPVDAVRLQLVLLYVLLGGVALAGLLAVTLAQRAFTTPAHQLRELPLTK